MELQPGWAIESGRGPSRVTERSRGTERETKERSCPNTPPAPQGPANSTRGLDSPTAKCETYSNLTSQQLCLPVAGVGVDVTCLLKSRCSAKPPFGCLHPLQGISGASGGGGRG